MAIATGVFIERILLIFLGRIEVLERLYLYSYRTTELLLLLNKHFIDGREVVFIDVIDACPVLCSAVVALLVQ